MPYVAPKAREVLDTHIDAMRLFIQQKGDYNYIITRLMHEFIINYEVIYRHLGKRGPCYDAFNDAVGILECAKAELLRAVVGPYEQKKKKSNGNISILDTEHGL